MGNVEREVGLGEGLLGLLRWSDNLLGMLAGVQIGFATTAAALRQMIIHPIFLDFLCWPMLPRLWTHKVMMVLSPEGKLLVVEKYPATMF